LLLISTGKPDKLQFCTAYSPNGCVLQLNIGWQPCKIYFLVAEALYGFNAHELMSLLQYLSSADTQAHLVIWRVDHWLISAVPSRAGDVAPLEVQPTHICVI
jgi:hypothetical protein